MIALLERADGSLLLGILIGVTVAIAGIWIVLLIFGILRG